VTTRGDRFEMPDGSVYEVTAAAAESDGEFVGMNFVFPPGSTAPPPHVHPSQTEEFELLEGPFELLVEGEWRALRIGERAAVAPGILHTFRNASKEETVVVRNVHRPAGRFEEFIEAVHRLVSTRRIRGPKDPRILLYLATVLVRYEDTLRTERLRERLPIKALAAVGRLLRLDR
jgi:quercetin dioxygenase-like cupin family protein